MDENTAYFTTTLRGALRTLVKGKDKDAARACWQHYERECKRLLGESRDDALSVAAALHGAIDDSLDYMLRTSPNGAKRKCQPGCSACCRLSVDITPGEAQLLRAYAGELGVQIDEARLDRQAAAKTVGTWGELQPQDKACVFLSDDGMCRVYEHRPGACRKYLVITDPALCDIERYPGGQVEVLFDIQAEIIASTAMTAFGVDSMARMLVATRQATDVAAQIDPDPERRGP